MSNLSSIDKITTDYLSKLIGKEIIEIKKYPISEGHTQCMKLKVDVCLIENNEVKYLKLFLKSFDSRKEYEREKTRNRQFGTDLDEDLEIMHNWAHFYEMNFYNFINEIKDIYSDINDVIPRCHFVKENIIALENLCDTKNLKTLSMWNPGLKSDETIKILKAYAKLHGSGLKINLNNELASFDEIASNRDHRIIYSAKKSGFDLNLRLNEIIEKMNLSDLSKENLKIIKELGFVGLNKKFSDYKTLLHGDANPNNILVDDNFEKIMLVDFQEGCLGNPMSDIGWFAITSGEFQNEKELLEEYIRLLSHYSNKNLNKNVFFNDFYVGIMIAAYLILMVVGVVSIEYKDTFFWKLVNSCALKLNKFDSHINFLLKNK